MRRGLAYLLVWTLTTTVTVTASWFAMRSVLDVATSGSALPLSAAALGSPAPPSAGASQRTDVPVTGGATGSPASASAAASSASASPSPGPAQKWAVVPNGHGGTAYKRNFVVRGGVATVWVEPGDVRVVSVRGHRGFRVEQARHDQQSLTISFVSGPQVSRIFVAWRDGPYAEVSESVT